MGFKKCASNGSVTEPGTITLESLQRIYAESFKPRQPAPFIPNPCDVTPEVWEALKKRCVMLGDVPVNALFNFGGLEVHVRPDVENWSLNVCTCREDRDAGKR